MNLVASPMSEHKFKIGERLVSCTFRWLGRDLTLADIQAACTFSAMKIGDPPILSMTAFVTDPPILQHAMKSVCAVETHVRASVVKFDLWEKLGQHHHRCWFSEGGPGRRFLHRGLARPGEGLRDA
jgi:hypothetical protein